jgi:hypothetical protein
MYTGLFKNNDEHFLFVWQTAVSTELTAKEMHE